jgi:hypothetical protein
MTINLTQGKNAVVDDDDYNKISKYKWYAHKERTNWYAIRNQGNKKIKMHWDIVGKNVDHINHNGLDNRKCNLRKCSIHQNTMNSIIKKSNKSGFKGVSWDKENNKWVAQIMFNYKQIKIGRFTDKIQASLAYEKMAKKLFGEFAYIL